MTRCSSTFAFMLLFLAACGGSGADFGPLACLKTPSSPSKFLATLNATVNALPRVAAVVSGFANFDGDFRLSNAVADCVELVDLSSQVLDWSFSAAQNCTGQREGTGDLTADLQTWLGAALTNMDTCMDGLEGTKTGVNIKKSISDNLNRVTPMLRELLDSITSSCTTNNNQFSSPSWVQSEMIRTRIKVNVTVAADGSGDYKTVGEAVEAAPEKSKRRFVIHVKRGVYREYVEIKKRKWNIMMVGDDMDSTVISGNRSVGDRWSTFKSATVIVNGRGFIARSITFENTAGPAKGQAVALRSDSDLAVFYRCAFKGFQDTLYTHTMRQFFRDCHVSGTVDFIFGNAAAVFQNCHVTPRQGLPGQKYTVTAQGRASANDTTGFSFQFCNFTAGAGENLPPANSTYLGRPWRSHSRTVVMQSYLDDVIAPRGWLAWTEGFEKTLYYGEYMNSGPGSGLGGRVKWAGFHVINGPKVAVNFTVARFIEGNSWLPATGVDYRSGLDQ